MRPIVFFMSIYFLLLALLPCYCDRQTVDSQQKKIELDSKTHNESDSIRDLCTPFCSCTNLHNTNFIAENSFDIEILDITSTKKVAIYNENHTSFHLSSHWRPPKA